MRKKSELGKIMADESVFSAAKLVFLCGSSPDDYRGDHKYIFLEGTCDPEQSL